MSLEATGVGALVAGFVTSEYTRAVLVRVIGPALANFSVPGALAIPRLQTFDSSGRVVAENDDRGMASNAGAIVSTEQAVGAFLLPIGSQDAGMLLTLPPGAYSAQVSGVGNTTGEGLVEVYEVP
jgi:hypothetical protein